MLSPYKMTVTIITNIREYKLTTAYNSKYNYNVFRCLNIVESIFDKHEHFVDMTVSIT